VVGVIDRLDGTDAQAGDGQPTVLGEVAQVRLDEGLGDAVLAVGPYRPAKALVGAHNDRQTREALELVAADDVVARGVHDPAHPCGDRIHEQITGTDDVSLQQPRPTPVRTGREVYNRVDALQRLRPHSGVRHGAGDPPQRRRLVAPCHVKRDNVPSVGERTHENSADRAVRAGN
jgi:hypothetical protein